MSSMDKFKIAYIGGGSRFVVTLLHGLASQAEALKNLDKPIDLVLMDPNIKRAGEMARYAETTAQQTGLRLRAAVTDDQSRALDGANWVLYSAGLWAQVKELYERFGTLLGPVEPDSAPGMAIEGAVYWPSILAVVKEMQRRAPEALFSTLANPTDVFATAVERKFRIPAIGICVEVPQLKRWLAVHLRMRESEIDLEYLGVNHCGYVTRWTVAGQDGTPLLRQRLAECMDTNNWDPQNDAFAKMFLATGYMRTSPYHHRPYRQVWTEERQQRHRAFENSQGINAEEYRKEMLERALSEGKMIEEDDTDIIHDMLMPYPFSDTRHTLGALAVGLAGGEAGPVPIQVRNGYSNTSLPPDIWLEIPALVKKGEILPQTVTPLPDWLLRQISLLAHQRSLIADWFAGKDAEALLKAFLLLPGEFSLESLLALAKDLTAFLSGTVGTLQP